ncbi:formimidoylglutamate deiminase [Acidocella aminolytica]|uniref:Formiminoglutamate deiminase n=1 Tax=Acidocella aminolytica 101 = DSM 11237 TaxID=1120923 RepID=A0A0D6PJ47_9PROT|nr:formimidoylglutamate deiminase [Acidocella aminolytica]GAN81416.1 formiminoglutamate deiminase [Acidocella aminolytica 101 = DSM 11237]GBQ40911.1 cytosine deaminase [Acidocella aminolytica 101 = DSM 11237]SHF33086.1 formiminoglutamate deiminase [Acidocella aminolytica 101 = DSM 11237]
MSERIIFRHALLPGGWEENVALTMSNGVISKIETGVAGGTAIALPGMPNLHSHSFQRAMAGRAELRGPTADSFWTWRELMYRLALSLDPDDVQAIARLAFTEMLEGGFTAVAEFHYLHHAPDGSPYADIGEMASRLTEAANEVGIELVLLPAFYAHSGFGEQKPAEGQRRFINSLDSYAKLHARCRALTTTGCAPHSLRAATLEEIDALAALNGDAPFHIHIAEQAAEVEACIAYSGARPVEYLLANAPVSPGWCLVHATHITRAEALGMEKAQVVAGLCPITEANLGDGIFPAQHYSGAYGIGSDSNVLIDVGRELQMLEYSQRLGQRQRNVMATEAIRPTATALYQRTLDGGARALRMRQGLSVGAPASFVTIAGDNPEQALAEAVFTSRQTRIHDVWVRGRQRVWNGRHENATAACAGFDAVLRKRL